MPSQGSILVRVFTSDAYLPLAGAPVILTQTDADGAMKLLAIQMTNSSGVTEPVYVPTPEEYLSLRPDPPSVPYAMVGIRVSYPGYTGFQSRSIPIFPGIETVQEVQLQPAPKGGPHG